MSDKPDKWWQRQIVSIVETFFTVGLVLAVLQSWEKFHSVMFSLWAGFGGWFYVLMPSAFDYSMK